MDMPLMLVDIATVYYRAYYSMPESLKAPDGRQINAVRGTLDALMHFVDTYEPEHLVTAWDLAWRPDWRVELLPSYKTARVAAEDEEQMPDTLSDQVDSVRHILEELGVACVGVEDYEADDVVAQYARESDMKTYVVSGDRDLFQLIDDQRDVTMLYLGTGISKHTVANNSYIQERFGIRASQYADYSLMRGDASDGLPGVKGIGEKTAAVLLQTFDNIENIVNAALNGDDRIKPRIAQSLIDHQDYLAAAAQVVVLDRTISVPVLQSDWKNVKHSPTLEELGMKRYQSAWEQVTSY
jgi:5'-3' exonuclease